MKCMRKFRVKHDSFSRDEYSFNVREGLQVPCGTCLACRCNRAAEWAARLVHESQYYSKKCFVTLTYDDNNIPICDKGYSLRRSDVMKFYRRLRKKYKNCNLKYYGVGEYGSCSLRPHYHAIIFGWMPDINDVVRLGNGYYTSEELMRMWPHGIVTVGSVEDKSIYYVCGYMIKRQDKEVLDGLELPYLNVSKGIGLRWCMENIDKVRRCEIEAEGRKAAVPRYYRKKVGVDKDVLREKSVQEVVFMAEKYGLEVGYDLLDKIMEARRIDQKELEQLLERGKNKEL